MLLTKSYTSNKMFLKHTNKSKYLYVHIHIQEDGILAQDVETMPKMYTHNIAAVYITQKLCSKFKENLTFKTEFNE